MQGYRPQSSEAVQLVNKHKLDEELILRHLDVLKAEPGIDQRWLAVGRTHIEEGFMAINRAVFKPERVSLDGAVFKPDVIHNKDAKA